MKSLPGLQWDEEKQRYFAAPPPNELRTTANASSGFLRPKTKSGKSVKNDKPVNAPLWALLGVRKRMLPACSVSAIQNLKHYVQKGLSNNAGVCKGGGKLKAISVPNVMPPVFTDMAMRGSIMTSTYKLSAISGPQQLYSICGSRTLGNHTNGTRTVRRATQINEAQAVFDDTFTIRPRENSPFAVSQLTPSKAYVTYCTDFFVACDNVAPMLRRNNDPFYEFTDADQIGGENVNQYQPAAPGRILIPARGAVTSLKMDANYVGFTTLGSGMLKGKMEIHRIDWPADSVVNIEGSFDVWDMVWSIEEKRAISVGDRIYSVDMERNQEIWGRPVGGNTCALCLDADAKPGPVFLAGHRNGSVCVWDLRAKAKVRRSRSSDNSSTGSTACTSVCSFGLGSPSTPNLCVSRHFGTRVVLRDLRKDTNHRWNACKSEERNIVWQFNSGTKLLGELCPDTSLRRFVAVGYTNKTNCRDSKCHMGSKVFMFDIRSPDPLKTFVPPSRSLGISIAAPALIRTQQGNSPIFGSGDNWKQKHFFGCEYAMLTGSANIVLVSPVDQNTL